MQIAPTKTRSAFVLLGIALIIAGAVAKFLGW